MHVARSLQSAPRSNANNPHIPFFFDVTWVLKKKRRKLDLVSTVDDLGGGCLCPKKKKGTKNKSYQLTAKVTDANIGRSDENEKKINCDSRRLSSRSQTLPRHVRCGD